MMTDRFDIYRVPRLQEAALLVGWQGRDIGEIGPGVIDFLVEKLGGEEVAEVNPEPFFSFDGASFIDDIIQVPESKFWACEESNLLLLKSDEPSHAQYDFLNCILDFADKCQVAELYTLNGAPSLVAHTSSRRILTLFNDAQFREKLGAFEELEEMTWEGPPAVSSYLLWVARRRGLPGVSLWPEVPFYLAVRSDPAGVLATLSFLDILFGLELQIEELHEQVEEFNARIDRLRQKNRDIDEAIDKLEKGFTLDEKEQVKLTRDIYELL